MSTLRGEILLRVNLICWEQGDRIVMADLYLSDRYRRYLLSSVSIETDRLIVLKLN